MTEAIFEFLVQLDDILWNRIGLLIILSIGVYLTIYSKFFQFRALFKLKTYIKDLIICAEKGKQGIHQDSVI